VRSGRTNIGEHHAPLLAMSPEKETAPKGPSSFDLLADLVADHGRPNAPINLRRDY
jgi:hypothetical protein